LGKRFGSVTMKGNTMQTQFRDFLIKPMLALAIAIPAMMAGNVNAEAGDRGKRAAIIAGAVIGGAIVYNSYKRKKYKRKHYRSGYGYGYRHGGYRRHKVYRHGGYRRHKVYRHGGYRRHKVYRHGGYRRGGYYGRHSGWSTVTR